MEPPTALPFQLTNNAYQRLGLWTTCEDDYKALQKLIACDIRALFKFYRQGGEIQHYQLFGSAGYTAGELCLYILRKTHSVRATRYYR